jgi:hypothetical protein
MHAFCIACEGSGKASNGQPCHPCQGTGQHKPSLAPYALAFRDRETQLRDAQAIVTHLSTLEITTDQEYTRTAEWLKGCTAAEREYEAKRKAITKPLADAKREVDSWFKPIVDTWGNAARVLKAKLQEYQAKQMAQRQAIAQRMVQSQGDVPTTMALAAQAQRTVVPDVANVIERRTMRWRVTDESQIPRQYWTIDSAAVNAAMRAGTPIAGVEYYYEQGLTVRS